jgi:hypothetical protein
MNAATLTWTHDTTSHKIARLGDLVLFLDREMRNYGAGDRRNGYQWTACIPATGVRRVVTGKREAAALLKAAAV